MENKGYSNEAKYLRVVCNWRHVCDERGLTDEQHHNFNMKVLSYIIDDLMPWHRDEVLQDFSLLEINLYVMYYVVFC